MKLSKLYSNNSAQFTPIEFNSGLNVVIAEIRLPGNRKKDTHNLGKTLLGRLLDFCFLLGREKSFFLFKHLDRFNTFVFFLEIELEDATYLTVRRSVEDASKVSFKRHEAGRQDFSALDESGWDHWELPFDRSRELLDSVLDWRALEPWPFRKIIGYLNDIEVVQVFEESGQSAKTANRPKFQEAFTYLESHSGITHLIVDKWDRFSRSNEDAVIYRVQLRSLRVQLIAATQPASDDPQGRLMVNVLQSFAQFDNEVRAERSVRGMKQKAEAGGFVNPAPLGYKNNGKNTPSLLLNETVAPLIRGLYERVAGGDRLTDALEWARTRGLCGRRGARIAVQTASKLLRNPAYKGWLELTSMRISRQGDWEPIVDAGLWAKVQSILNGNAAPVLVAHTRLNGKYVLRGVIVCDTCGKLVTASTSKSKSKKPHAYYHCIQGHMRVRVDYADSMFAKVLEALAPNPRRLRVVEECFREAWSQRNGTAQADHERLQTQLTTLHQRKRRLLSLVQDGLLQPEEFGAANDALKEEIVKVDAALTDAEESNQELDCDTAFSYLEHLLYNQHLFWDESDTTGKHRLAKQLFPSGIKCTKEGFGTPVSHSIFSVMRDENVGEEELVALPGIEPGF